ncbi:hypothetical protein [Lysinibacillus cavernae]|uniref:hypothetical protein n=1 Tax=Lysinibacillus cavernae TaxID=2666135 RepID=UPI0012D8A76C|nr:hypothetical protein [Lysinibacillus cavernae]
MSMATYIGLNFPVAINDDYMENEVEIRGVFLDSEDCQILQHKHFTTPFLYELETKGDPLWQMHDENKVHSPHNYEKSTRTFLHVCDFLKDLLPKGDFCEIYVCWMGEEGEDSEKKFELMLDQRPIVQLEINEKCLITIKN